MDKNKKRIVIYVVAFMIALVITYFKEYYKIGFLNTSIILLTGSASLAAIFFTVYGLIETYGESKSKRICYVSNNTTFSNRIYDGIVYSKLNDTYFISRKIIGSSIKELINFMSDDAYHYRGLIIRYKFKNVKDQENDNKQFAQLVNKYLKERDNSIVFVDTRVDFLDLDKGENWSVVNSDLSKGGLIVAKEIEKVCKFYNNPYVLIVDGPKDDPNVNRRKEVIKNYEFIDNKKNVSKIYVNRLKKDVVFKEFESAINNKNTDRLIDVDSMKKEKVDALIMFCGNDQLTYDFMRTLNMKSSADLGVNIRKYFKGIFEENYDNLYLIGYDGLKDIDSPIGNDYAYKIDAFTNEFKYFSIDAKPYDQGGKSIEILNGLINNNFMHNKQAEEIDPTTYSSKLWPTDTKEPIYVFDLDGTIANTEQLHLETYNEVFKPFNITISLEEFSGYIGRTEETIHVDLKKRHNIDYDSEKMTEDRLEAYKKRVNETNYLYVPKKLLNIINDKSCKKYILSSQRKDIIELVLDKLNIKGSFEKIISCKNQNYSKIDALSNPIRFFNTSNITVCEDSASVLHLAKELKYKTIGVVHPLNKNIFVPDDCDIIIDDFLTK